MSQHTSRKKMILLVLLAPFVLLIGPWLWREFHKFPSNEEVKAAFLKENPNCTVMDVFVGEGDGSAAYFHIRYKKPGDEQLHEQEWQYLDMGDGKVVLNHKEILK